MFILDETGLCTTDMQNIIAIVGFVLRLIQWVVPIILILLGTIDLVKAVIAGKEDDIKKNQKVLVKRLIAAIIVFLIPLLVTTITGLIGADSWKDCWTKHHTDSITTILQEY